MSYGSGKGKILGIGTVGKSPMPLTQNVSYVIGLNFNLLSISQFCDSGYEISFNKYECLVINKDKTILSTGKWKNNLYEVNLSDLSDQNVTCLITADDERDTWHKKLRHLCLKYISKIASKDLIRGLPKISWKSNHLWVLSPR